MSSSAQCTLCPYRRSDTISSKLERSRLPRNCSFQAEWLRLTLRSTQESLGAAEYMFYLVQTLARHDPQGFLESPYLNSQTRSHWPIYLHLIERGGLAAHGAAWLRRR